jgi:hypothetical protein
MADTIKYYFESDICNIQKNYITLWHGFLKYDGSKIPITHEHIMGHKKQLYNSVLNDIFIEICEYNFYISLIDDFIYISSDFDGFYYYDSFEKHIKNVIIKIQTTFDININNGEFHANEMKHHGNSYRYNISKNSDKIVLKRKLLNCDFKKKNSDENLLISSLEKVKI